ncbi:hypothetical protein ACIQVA_36775 [Streptomyces microflavus]|uniref:hypothetical protein n=1 Tax=Streptomyces microflavus TaxID=1919 RepID=UPI00381BA7F0
MAIAVLAGMVVSSAPATAAPGSATYKVGCGNTKLLLKDFSKASRNTRTVIILNPDKKAKCVYEVATPKSGAAGNLANLLSRGVVVVQGNGATIKSKTMRPYAATIQVTQGSLTLRDVTVESNTESAVKVRDLRNTESGQGTLGTLILAGNSVLSGPGQTGAQVDGTMEMQDQSRVTGFHHSGIYNTGTLIMSGNSSISGNSTRGAFGGGGVLNRGGTLTMKGSAAITGNTATGYVTDSPGRYGTPEHSAYIGGVGGGITNDRDGHLTVQDQATVSDNHVVHASGAKFPVTSDESGKGGGIYNGGNATVATGSIRQKAHPVRRPPPRHRLHRLTRPACPGAAGHPYPAAPQPEAPEPAHR